MRRRGCGVEKRMWPMARAVRWVVGLEEVEMRWISEVGVRWGRVVGSEGGGVVGGGGSILGVVVEIERIDVKRGAGLERRWRGMLWVLVSCVRS